jgi:hypothetical protein
VNPALTIAAQALRVADHISGRAAQERQALDDVEEVEEVEK